MIAAPSTFTPPPSVAPRTLPPPDARYNADPHAHPVEQFLGDLVADAENFARREPAKAAAAALAAGVLLNVVPTRFIVGTVTAVTVTAARPILLSLGIVKALEMFLAKTNTPNPS